jgi:cation diffusion facilitator CzcD-associated flavoprotein CzcO
VEREADVVIFATGFHATDPPLAPHLVGRDGVSLADTWRGSPAAYMGTTVAGFPNLFLLLGPNTGLGHNSVMLMVEAQIEHVLGVMALMDAREAQAVEPDRDAQARYVAWIDERLATTVWNSGGCNSWYLDVTGRNSALWPERVGRFRRTVSRVRPADYRFRGDRAAG